MNYYATSNSPGHPAALLQFDNEVDRDDFVSRKPGERTTADPPEDTTGFRVFQLHEPHGRPLICKARAISPPMPPPRSPGHRFVENRRVRLTPPPVYVNIKPNQRQS